MRWMMLLLVSSEIRLMTMIEEEKTAVERRGVRVLLL
jgi:hypothetical protein